MPSSRNPRNDHGKSTTGQPRGENIKSRTPDDDVSNVLRLKAAAFNDLLKEKRRQAREQAPEKNKDANDGITFTAAERNSIAHFHAVFLRMLPYLDVKKPAHAVMIAEWQELLREVAYNILQQDADALNKLVSKKLSENEKIEKADKEQITELRKLFDAYYSYLDKKNQAHKDLVATCKGLFRHLRRH